MGMNQYKVTYKCDCGCDYGSCERRNFFLLEMSRSTDYYRLYHKFHADEVDSKLTEIFGCGDNGMEALAKIINCSNSPEKLNENDIKELKNI